MEEYKVGDWVQRKLGVGRNSGKSPGEPFKIKKVLSSYIQDENGSNHLREYIERILEGPLVVELELTKSLFANIGLLSTGTSDSKEIGKLFTQISQVKFNYSWDSGKGSVYYLDGTCTPRCAGNTFLHKDVKVISKEEFQQKLNQLNSQKSIKNEVQGSTLPNGGSNFSPAIRGKCKNSRITVGTRLGINKIRAFPSRAKIKVCSLSKNILIPKYY